MNVTDMNKVKIIARAMLYLNLEFDEYFIVHHPFFNSPIYPKPQTKEDELGFYDLHNEDDLLLARKEVEKEIDRTENYGRFLMLISKPYLPAFFKYTKNYLSEEDYNKFLAYMWISVEFTNNDKNISPNEFIRIFKKANKDILMDEDERKAYNNLDDILTVYRGVKPKSSTKALSWTTDKKVAQWFADRWEKNGKVYKANIHKKDVLAYFIGRGESETVLDYHKLFNIEELN